MHKLSAVLAGALMLGGLAINPVPAAARTIEPEVVAAGNTCRLHYVCLWRYVRRGGEGFTSQEGSNVYDYRDYRFPNGEPVNNNTGSAENVSMDRDIILHNYTECETHSGPSRRLPHGAYWDRLSEHDLYHKVSSHCWA